MTNDPIQTSPLPRPMPGRRHDTARTSRRDFLRKTLQGSVAISIAAATPAFLRRAVAAGNNDRDTVLVVVQLTGGNDGLNTVIPHTDPLYRQKRPKLAISPTDVLKINDQLGFHPGCRGLADLLEDGKLAVVQGVGYPDPNRSHFESMDIWHTCRRKTDARSTGWLGRFLDAAYSGEVHDAPAVHLGQTQQPLAVVASDVRVPSIQSLERFRLDDGGDRQIVELVTQLSAAPRPQSDSLLDFVQTSTSSAITTSQRVEQARAAYQPSVTYPDSGLAEKLRTVAQLIDAELKTRIYYVELDGFDTHSQQAAAHASLLSEFGGAVNSFIGDLNQHGHGDRVVVMAFSEFGRRVEENASEGTDHGAAAPMFVAGNRVRSGVIGEHPSLADLFQDDLTFHTDFRQVYAAVLESWLSWPSKTILDGEYRPIELFA